MTNTVDDDDDSIRLTTNDEDKNEDGKAYVFSLARSLAGYIYHK